MSSIERLVSCGTKVWLDSVDPQLIKKYIAIGITGATSNPIIISNLIKSGAVDKTLVSHLKSGKTNDHIAWLLTDELVSEAEKVFLPVYQRTNGDDGFVSFELDPLLEDSNGMSLKERVKHYVDLGKKWSVNHPNRMLKVPATDAGIAALTELAYHGVPLNVTLIFTDRQYAAARNAIFEGASARGNLDRFKAVYSVFVSRIDVYVDKMYPNLPPEAKGTMGIFNAQKMWQDNEKFWKQHPSKLRHEMIFASTGVKSATEKPWKYVASLAGSDIQTNPPETLAALEQNDITFENTLQIPTSSAVLSAAGKIDWKKLEQDLLQEGIKKFVDPQKELLALIETKRKSL
ncbi:MAG: transaldolase family protein [Oligoflexales bacterium]